MASNTNTAVCRASLKAPPLQLAEGKRRHKSYRTTNVRTSDLQLCCVSGGQTGGCCCCCLMPPLLCDVQQSCTPVVTIAAYCSGSAMLQMMSKVMKLSPARRLIRFQRTGGSWRLSHWG